MAILPFDLRPTDSREVRVVSGSRGTPLRVRQRGRWLQVINVQRRWQALAPTLGTAPCAFFELALEDGSVCTVGRPHGPGPWIETLPGSRALLPQSPASSYTSPPADLPSEGQMFFVPTASTSLRKSASFPGRMSQFKSRSS